MTKFKIKLKKCYSHKYRMKNSSFFLNKYLRIYNTKGISISAKKLRNKIIKAVSQAKKNYKKLKEPKISSIGVYIDIWVRKIIVKDIASKSIKEISIDNPPSSSKSLVEYFSLFPYELHEKLRKKLFNVEIEKRKKVWKGFKLPIEKIEKRFKRMVIEKTKFAQKKEYPHYIDMFFDKYKIPKSDYKYFTENINKTIKYCNQQLPKTNNLPSWFYSKFNLPCFICKTTSFPFKNLEEAFNSVTKEYQILNKFKNKIDIKQGKESSMFYKEETDHFEIVLDKNLNTRHQIMDLIHELAHTIDYLNDFSKKISPMKKGSYQNEKKALKIEIAILKKLAPSLLESTFTEALLVFRRTLFEIELYTNPNQNLRQLYALTFNQCFKKAKQKTNPLYILDERIVFRPFSSLPYAIAQCQVFSNK
ncbi:hypothetical protein KKC08_00025 [Patescibacteria group bacterium]|nr:hypothetical protein [Patescibacteria group bacterium]MBU4396540.1 hypothetical protein [Patescibacteria group bacterium]MCG2701602.1 hypothetical protein [Candidatus Parcubacteria bacterium]